jgi:hypothetical protein
MGFIIMTNVYQWVLVAHVNFFFIFLCITMDNGSYLTSEFSGGISEFTELPFGYDRSCIRRNLPVTALGTKPKGEHTKFLRGFFLKGPAILC